MYILVDGDLLNSVLLIWEEANEAMVKLTCPRSTSRGIWYSLEIEPLSQNSHPTSSTTIPRTHLILSNKNKSNYFFKTMIHSINNIKISRF